MDAQEYKALFPPMSKVLKVFEVLEDRQWHCRSHEYGHVETTQLAGSGGIQGLQRGSSKRPGAELESTNRFCVECDKTTRQDRWTGRYAAPSTASAMSDDLKWKVLRHFNLKEVINGTSRASNELVIDHKFPMTRWPPGYGDADREDMSEGEIGARFQLLKKTVDVNDNLLKSRACERCYRTGRRGTPFGIRFYYKGGPMWDAPTKQDESGCAGCGWYDFAAWRDGLNKFVSRRTP